ncbi:MAG: hypothetical protein LBT40_18265 [Deltaproteobacteria bacterium]|nr:hypothetical protein [Deltaproteobacteria bacterium]
MTLAFIQKIAAGFASRLPDSARTRAFAGPVPSGPAAGARASYARGADPSWMILLVDESEAGDGSSGLLATAQALYALMPGSAPRAMALDSVWQAGAEGAALFVNGELFHGFSKADGAVADAVSRAVGELALLTRHGTAARAGEAASDTTGSLPGVPQAGSMPHQGFPPQPRGYPGGAPGYPPQQGFPAQAQGYPGAAPGYAPPPQGFPPQLQGYPGGAPGYPPQQGVPAQAHGYPGAGPGYPPPPHGYPAPAQGYPGVPGAAPSAAQLPPGYPAPPQPLPDSPRGYPGTAPGYPAAPQEFSVAPQGYPGAVPGSPPSPPVPGYPAAQTQQAYLSPSPGSQGPSSPSAPPSSPGAPPPDFPSPTVGDFPSSSAGDHPSPLTGDFPVSSAGDRPSPLTGGFPVSSAGDRPSTQVGNHPAPQPGDSPASPAGDHPGPDAGGPSEEVRVSPPDPPSPAPELFPEPYPRTESCHGATPEPFYPSVPVLLETPPDPEEEMLKRLRRLLLTVDQAQLKPDIEPARAAMAITAFAHGMGMDEMLLLVDNSSMGGGGIGIAASARAVCVKSLFGMPISVALDERAPSFSVEDEDIMVDGGVLVKLENVTGGLLPLNDVAVALNFLAGRAAGLPDPGDPSDDPLRTPGEFPPGPPMPEDELLERLSTMLAGCGQVRVRPALDPRCLATALGTYAAGLREDDVLFQADDTRSGDASFGLAVTRDRTYARWSGSDPATHPLGPALPEIMVKDDFIGVNGRRAARLTLSSDTARKAVANAMMFLARVNNAAARGAAGGSGPAGPPAGGPEPGGKESGPDTGPRAGAPDAGQKPGVPGAAPQSGDPGAGSRPVGSGAGSQPGGTDASSRPVGSGAAYPPAGPETGSRSGGTGTGFLPGGQEEGVSAGAETAAPSVPGHPGAKAPGDTLPAAPAQSPPGLPSSPPDGAAPPPGAPPFSAPAPVGVQPGQGPFSPGPPPASAVSPGSGPFQGVAPASASGPPPAPFPPGPPSGAAPSPAPSSQAGLPAGSGSAGGGGGT